MNVKNLFNRPITSSGKVRIVVSKIVRGNAFFLDKKKLKNKVLLNVGCGTFPTDGFINLDYGWLPSLDMCWDIVKKKYPFEDNSMEGIFTEHTLEHIPFDSCLANLKEFHRLLKPGGVVRIVVPDGEIYCDLYQKRKLDRTIKFPYGESEPTGMISINRIFRSHGHQFIYDYETFELLLKKAGFSHIKKESFGKGSDSRLLIDRQDREIESLYVEAIK